MKHLHLHVNIFLFVVNNMQCRLYYPQFWLEPGWVSCSRHRTDREHAFSVVSILDFFNEVTEFEMYRTGSAIAYWYNSLFYDTWFFF